MSWKFGRQAARDFVDIIAFVASENPTAAERLRDQFVAAFDLLSDQPRIGHTRLELTGRPLRFWNVGGRYLIAYSIQENSVVITRIFGPGRNIADLLR